MNLFKRFSFMLLLAWLQPCMAEAMSDSQIKSAYVFNFIKFVEWPDGVIGTDGEVTICVIGNDVLDGVLSTLDGRKAGNRQLRVLAYANADKSLSDCHVVFIGESEHPRFLALINALGNSPALTISDIDGFAEKGGGIGFLYREDKIAFEVNMAATKKAKLRLPAQLLNLASYVYGR